MAIICLCHRVTERTVRRAVDAGAATIDEVGATCRAGTCCHSCHDSIAAIVDERRVTVRRRLFAV